MNCTGEVDTVTALLILVVMMLTAVVIPAFRRRAQRRAVQAQTDLREANKEAQKKVLDAAKRRRTN